MLALADVAVTVSNARVSASWWREKLGFDVHVVDGPGGHAVVVAPPGDRFLLHLCEGIEPVEPGNTGIAFMTEDIHSLVGAMMKAGVKFPEPLREANGNGRAKFADPDGNVFWVLKAPARFIRAETRRRGRAPRPHATLSTPAKPVPRRRK